MNNNFKMKESCGTRWYGEYEFSSPLGYELEAETKDIVHGLFHFMGDLVSGILATKDTHLREIFTVRFAQYLEEASEIAEEVIEDALNIRAQFVETNYEQLIGHGNPLAGFLDLLTEEERSAYLPTMFLFDEEEEDDPL
jgi:hypothetical protein